MAQPAPKPTIDPSIEPSEPTAEAFEALTIDDAGAASPARQMQNTLGREFGMATDASSQWSARQTMAFVIFSCGAFWTGLYFLIAALVG